MDAVGLKIERVSVRYPTGIYTGTWKHNRVTFECDNVLYKITTDIFISEECPCEITIIDEGNIYVKKNS